jgi:hypothetical protein
VTERTPEPRRAKTELRKWQRIYRQSAPFRMLTQAPMLLGGGAGEVDATLKICDRLWVHDFGFTMGVVPENTLPFGTRRSVAGC